MMIGWLICFRFSNIRYTRGTRKKQSAYPGPPQLVSVGRGHRVVEEEVEDVEDSWQNRADGAGGLDSLVLSIKQTGNTRQCIQLQLPPRCERRMRAVVDTVDCFSCSICPHHGLCYHSANVEHLHSLRTSHGRSLPSVLLYTRNDT